MPKVSLIGKKVVVTAGGTRENIDPVRYIGNYSSGKMGFAFADMAFTLGAEVVLVSTVPVERGYEVVLVNSALDMQQALADMDFDWLIMAAAVADFRPKTASAAKIKKQSDQNELTLTLVKNPDILAEISKDKAEHQVIIGFCAETDGLIEHAKIKLAQKGCDFLVANDVSGTDIGFSSDYNEVYVLSNGQEPAFFEKDLKENIAKRVLEYVYAKSL